jgi:hypothetical protein
VFAAIMLMMIGVFHFMAGLVGIVDDEFYVVTSNQPWWSILMIVLSVAVIWALTVHGRDIATPAQ